MARDYPAPTQRTGNDDAANFGYAPKGSGLGPKSMADSIGGTYRNSTKIYCDQALSGPYQPIEDDRTPGAGGGGEYLPKN